MQKQGAAALRALRHHQQGRVRTNQLLLYAATQDSMLSKVMTAQPLMSGAMVRCTCLSRHPSQVQHCLRCTLWTAGSPGKQAVCCCQGDASLPVMHAVEWT